MWVPMEAKGGCQVLWAVITVQLRVKRQSSKRSHVLFLIWEVRAWSSQCLSVASRGHLPVLPLGLQCGFLFNPELAELRQETRNFISIEEYSTWNLTFPTYKTLNYSSIVSYMIVENRGSLGQIKRILGFRAKPTGLCILKLFHFAPSLIDGPWGVGKISEYWRWKLLCFCNK